MQTMHDVLKMFDANQITNCTFSTIEKFDDNFLILEQGSGKICIYKNKFVLSDDQNGIYQEYESNILIEEVSNTAFKFVLRDDFVFHLMLGFVNIHIYRSYGPVSIIKSTQQWRKIKKAISWYFEMVYSCNLGKETLVLESKKEV